MKTNELEKEIQYVESFPDGQFIKIIQEVGFECDCCGKCCTSEFNDHVFLLDEDAERIIENAGPGFLRPAPYFDVCDNLGRFYVSGYALKTRHGGDCVFYTGGKCEHYGIRPAICRIFPYMLHREPDEDGNVEFRQVGGLNLHGLYHSELNDETCNEILRAVKKYEISFLRQKLKFNIEVENHFKKHHLKHSRQMYDRMMREFNKGNEIEVYIFFKGNFEKRIISK